MLFPVTVYGANGKVKEFISKEMLHKRHWEIFRKNEEKHTFHGPGKQTVTRELKAKLDLEFPPGSLSNNN
ncbi:MAG: hypothetical protein F3743_03525 [Nitrospinae bacterium]|nr:hypothetical protein [Nitrospinota bacterium]MZH04456.1 hypothetical protein [Nitrospinota bacterium]MZH13516.1 hypothetical protein [Nitrospinota bacterium]